MYSLRTITPDSGVERNQMLGDSYTLIRSKADNFKDIFSAFYGVEVYSRDDYYGSENKPVFAEGDPNNPYMGRDITGNMEYDKKFFWMDAAEAYKKGFKFICAGKSVHYLESDGTVAPHDFTLTHVFVSVGEDRVYPIKKYDWNFIVTENGTTYAKL